jgi:hypothetical protein
VFSFACGDHCPPCAPIDAPAQGTVSASWAISIDAGRLETCSIMGATSVALTLHPHAGGSDVTLTSPCVPSTASFTVPTGTYDVTPTLLAADGGTIATATLHPIVIISSGQSTAIDPILFIPSGRTGDVALRLVAVGQGTNCQTLTGAPISSALLTLRASDGSCVDTTITRSRGGVFIGRYIVSCAHPTPTTCFEQDETLTVEGGLTAGPYAIGVTGVTPTAVCFLAEDTFTVGAGVANHPTIQLAALGGTGC